MSTPDAAASARRTPASHAVAVHKVLNNNVVIAKAGAVPLQLLELGLVFAVLAVVSDSMWVLAAAAARTWFARSPTRIERLTATGGGMMIGLGGILLVTGPKHGRSVR